MIIVQSRRLSGLGEVAVAKSAKEMALELLDERALILGEVKLLLEKWAEYLPAKYDRTWKKPEVAAVLIEAPSKLKPIVSGMPVSDPQLLTLVPQLQASRGDLIVLRDLLRQIESDNTPAESTEGELEDKVNDAIDSAVSNPMWIVLGLAALGAVVVMVNRR